MSQFSFSALGTEWVIRVDDGEIDQKLQAEILAKTEQFDQQFSRFILTSEANAFRESPAGTYKVSAEFDEFLHVCKTLQEDTQGSFDPAVGKLLELAGYDPEYHFTTQDVSSFKLPEWKVDGQDVTISDSVVFDTGGIGKGYWIDQLAALLKKHHFTHYIVDGGGDMVATTKKDGSPWKVALEWPGDPERAIGVVELKNQGLAVSDIYRRNWGEWHHIVDVKKLQSTQGVVWSAALAHNAWEADQFTSILSLADPSLHTSLAQKRNVEYLVLHTGGEIHVSQSWPGEIF
jgi:thiamine biosynthesis lipoprotein